MPDRPAGPRHPRRPRKAEELRRALAIRLIQVQPGAPLPPIRTLAAATGSSIGATQIALARLASDGIVTLDSRPGRGGILVDRNVGRLFEEAERMPLLLAMSLPSTARINGLATALRANLLAADVETYLTFIRGSRPRLAALAQGRCNVAIMSVLAARALAGDAFRIAATLPAGTFVREHRVFLAPGSVEAGRRLRVGIDRSSYDFERLAEMEFGSHVDYVPLNYLMFVREIERGGIDAGVLDVEDALMRIPPWMPNRPLSDRVLEALDGANLSTAFVIRADDVATRAVVEACLDAAAVVAIQDDVIEGRRPPEY
jgi:hypothetical protein